MESPDRFENYWYVFLKSGQLAVSPFGLNKLTDPTLIFDDFNSTNSDASGWWHLSCNYQFYAKTECTLYNTKVEVTKVVSLLGLTQYFFPKYSLTGVFGRTTN